jgi:signal transduction histidine kinase
MRHLYFRIYLALLASLAVFVLVAGVLWRTLADAGPASQASELSAALAQNVLPRADAPLALQQAALERLLGGMRADVALYSAARAPLARVGAAVPAPEEGKERSGWIRDWGAPPAWALRLGDGRWLVARVPHGRGHPALGLLLALALIALAVGVGAYPLARRLTSRLERLQAGVELLGAGKLSARVKVEGADEVAQLAQSFNRAAARIEDLVGAHKTLLANASHELRTPLARIRMAVELIGEAAGRERRVGLEQDVAELDALVDEILLASRLEALGKPETQEEVDLLALAAEECARYEEAMLDGDSAVVRGDPRLLRRMIRNLLENAHRHGAPPVEVRVARARGEVELRVCDAGAGVSEAERERVFESFHRASGARLGTGSGLGLALVRAIARQHGGEARCSGAGNCFSVTLPLTGFRTHPE